MNKLSTFFYTIKYLKFIQLWDRVKRKFTRPKNRGVSYTIANCKNSMQRYELITSSYKCDGSFCFLNKRDHISDWNDSSKDKLWLYNLHYFDDLNHSVASSRTELHIDLIDSWISENPYMKGNGWEPYTISVRTVNWIKWFNTLFIPKNEWLDSLALQVSALECQLEYHLLGNHLFSNGKALVFAGCYFSGDSADKWLRKGLSILEKEIPEQILDDGGNFELSPMYHNIILSDMLDLYNLSNAYPESISNSTKCYWLSVIEKMFFWSELMKHQDGEVSFFNDSAIGISPTISDLKGYAILLDIKSFNKKVCKLCHLVDSGYIIIQDDASKLILDVAKVGPDYIPGHAHADTLSFEMSIEGHRVFVNSGTSVYGVSDERLRQRKTESHNTVVVDGKDSSEVWSGFRVARRAYPSNPVITDKDGVISVECSHDGYVRLPGKVTHARKWQLQHGGLTISDHLSGSFISAEAHYHLHPDIRIEEADSDGQVTLHLPSGSQYTISAEGADIKVLDTTWHPEFGLSIANKKLVLNFKQNELHFVLTRA
ncbi:heparinase II/III family protein [Photobacterium frigidiphilum]|uniref:heparinase II/III family protein n=1 Tax=Photobacterium frigidiphilum TaxID=264736 RepID=UPI003D10C412